MTIILYDIPYSVPGKPWSGNTIKIRIALKLKGLPFKAEWVELPDIEPVLKKIGASPTSKNADGSDHYTVPVIHDLNTGKVIADSFAIALYLDATYPNTPKLIPQGSAAAIALFEHHIMYSVSMPVFSTMTLSLYEKLNPTSATYFRASAEKRHGRKLEDIAPQGPEREEAYKKLKEGLELVVGFLDKNGGGNSYYLGETLTYGDICLAALVSRFKIFLGQTEWKTVIGSHGERWEEIVRLAEE